MFEEIEQQAYDLIHYYSAESMCRLNDAHSNIELNNVIEGFENQFFSITQDEESVGAKKYDLLYVGYNKEDKLEGIVLKSGRNLKNRDYLTLYYSKIIGGVFLKNSLVIFNTFQSKLTQFYEKNKILCIPKYLVNTNFSAILPINKNSIDYLLHIDIWLTYKSFFLRDKYVSNKKEQQKIYLMYDRKDDKIKIGETSTLLKIRKKGVAEPTKRAKDPMIELITAWEAPKVFEDELHERYKNKRVRGEWFDLRASDLVDIDQMALKYSMIKIN